MGALVVTRNQSRSNLVSGINLSLKMTFSWKVCGSVDGGAGLTFGVCVYELLSLVAD